MAEATGAPIARLELLHHVEADLLDGDEHHLRNALAGLHLVGGLAAIPAGDEHLALVIGVDQAGQVAEDDAVLVASPVGTSTVSPGSTVSGSSIHARMSRPADPAVA